MQTEYYVLGYIIHLYFPKHKLAIEVDKFGHCDIRLMMMKVLIFLKLQTKFHRRINNSFKKSIKYEIPKRLLEFEFRLNHSVKSRCLRFISISIKQANLLFKL